MHMFSSSQLAKVYAMRNNLDVELCSIIAILHDIAVVYGKIRKNHDKESERYIITVIQEYNDSCLDFTEKITEEELRIIIEASTQHSDKGTITENPYIEMIKDVDSLDRYLYGIKSDGEYSVRVSRTLELFNIEN
jgi:uncharacterized protein